jgi:hypothetical protein
MAKERLAVRSTIRTTTRITTRRRTAIAKRPAKSVKSRATSSGSVLTRRRRRKIQKTTIITLAYNGDDDDLEEEGYIGIPNFQGIYESDQSEHWIFEIVISFVLQFPCFVGYFALLNFIGFSPSLHNNSPRSRPRSSQNLR